MSIFKRGKHAEAEGEPVSWYLNQAVAEAEKRMESGGTPGSSYGSNVAQDFPSGMHAVRSEWNHDTGGLEVEFAEDTPEETLSFYQVAGSKPVSPFEEELDLVLGEIRALLLEKNASYGDSALNPVRIMSDADAAEQIRIRMDDKLSRLYRGFAFEDTETGNPEDTLKDLVGYYFLLKIAEARNAQS